MGRNKGDPARSKARPSSSSFAASLLQTPVATAVGFGGYVGSARVDTGPSADGDLLMDVDGEASLHLRRLSKKDSTTKLKALTALTALFKERSSAELSALLPSWVFEYKRLVQDSSRQVRESSHIAMCSLVNSVGRGIAPHLRSLMGPWWVSQFDPSREVSEDAKSSFQMAFSGQKKRLEALIFCGNEIFTYLDENLKLTPQTTSDKTTPIEESTEKHERVVSCSLLALAAIIDILVGSLKTGPAATGSLIIDADVATKTTVTVTEAATKLCWNHKYMREYMRSKSSRIRSAVYQALRAYIQHIPQVFRDADMDSVAPLILGSFAEKDTACHQPMWDMLLLFAKGFPHAWDASSVRKVVFPRLFGYLRHGCYGSELLSYPSLLPLLSLIPPKSIAPSQSFLQEFFSNFWRGRPVAQLGSAYWLAFLNAIRECFIWTVKNAKRFAEAEGLDILEFQVALIDGVLLKLLWYDYIGPSAIQTAPSTVSATLTSSDGVVSVELKQTTPSKAAERKSLTSSGITNEDICACIVDAIQSLSGGESRLLNSFWGELQSNCLSIVKDSGQRWRSERDKDARISRIAEFFVMLGSKKTLKSGSGGDRWVLSTAVRPFVSTAFPIIKSAGDPESVKLLAKLTAVYGPTVFLGLSVATTEGLEAERIDEEDPERHRLLSKYFKEEIVPWCVDEDDELSGPKAELILAFIQRPSFQEHWDFVIAHITEGLHQMNAEADLKAVGVLSVLLEKVREIGLTSAKEGLGNLRVWWKSNKIDDAAILVASSSYLSKPASFRLVRSVLGGMSYEDPVPGSLIDKSAKRGEKPLNLSQKVTTIVSVRAARDIFQILLKRILSVLGLSEANWVKHSPSLFIDQQQENGELVSFPEDQLLTKEVLQSAATAIDIISECILCLPSLDRDSTVVGKLVASLFCLRWGCPRSDDSPSVEDEGFDSDLESEEDAESEFEAQNLGSMKDVEDASEETHVDLRSVELEQGWKLLMESVRKVQYKLPPSFCKSFTALTRFRVRQILIQCLRDAVFDETFGSVPRISVKVASWTKEVITFACEDGDEISQLLDSLLAPDDDWPLWVEVPTSLQIKPESKQPSCIHPGVLLQDQKSRHGRFASFVDVLSKTLSPREVFLGPSVYATEEKQVEASTTVVAGETDSSSQSSHRTWLVVELLCTWHWPGGSASNSVFPFLLSLSRASRRGTDSLLLWNVIETLFMGASQAASKSSSTDLTAGFSAIENEKKAVEEPFLRALLKLLKGLLEMEDGWSKADGRKLFRELVTKEDSVNFLSPLCDIRILPSVLSVLMPALRRKAGHSDDGEGDGGVEEEEWQSLLKNAVCEWLLLAKGTAPLVAYDDDSDDSGAKWIPVAVACFPVNSAGGAAAMAAALSLQVSPEEKALLLQLLQKQFSREAVAAVAAAAALCRATPEQEASDKKRRLLVELTLAKLVAAATAYCWFSFGVEEWEFLLSRLRSWMDDAVVDAEEFTESIASVVEQASEGTESLTDLVVEELESVVQEKDSASVELSSAAVAAFSLLRGLEQLEGAESSDALTHLQAANWKSLEMRALEDVLRLLLAIGLAESIAANSRGGAEKARSVIASWRKLQGQLWDNAADVALSASNQAREAAVRAVELWGVGKGAISALYALLFSPQPTMSLQWVAYNFLTSGHVLEMAITCGVVSSPEGESKADDAEEVGDDVSQETLTATVAQIRPELTSILGTGPSVILFQPLTSSLRVHYLLGWSLFLTRLSSLPASSATRERLVQYVQDSDTSATLLDFLLQHIPLEQNVGSFGARRKSSGVVTKTSSAAAATRAAATGSVAFAVEGLWPVQKENIVTLAGAVYGLVLLVLPACVRIWFTGLRDKALASAIEAFTTTHCSPQLLLDEFAKVQESAARAQEAGIDEEEFTVRANRGLREVTAVYKKEEAGMDIVIRMPACYPLRAVGVECTRRMGIDETLLRKWILSMAAFLRNQNGAVSEAIQMWKRNVDREFEGVEPCPICYSIIHTSNHSLPRLACKTCSNKFHSACLYKWFSTSHQSTCPLCKTPF